MFKLVICFSNILDLFLIIDVIIKKVINNMEQKINFILNISCLQMETGTPYLLFKDSVNQKCNQNNLGIIKSSNLCCEITEYSNENETAVCNLASIALPQFIKKSSFHFEDVQLYSKNNCIW